MDFNRNEQDFIWPEPTLSNRFTAFVRAFGAAFTRGVDVSDWQKDELNFLALFNSGIRFIIMRTSNGLEKDDEFDNFWKPAFDAGLRVGTYHLFRSNLGGAPQANFHLEILQPLRDYAKDMLLPSFADVETTDGTSNTTRINRLQAFLLTIESNFKKPGIYSSPGLANQLLTPTPSWINSYYQWVAHWTSASMFSYPSGWNNGKVWQYGIYPNYSWVDPVPGASGDIDVDWFLGTPEELDSWVGWKEPTSDLEQRVAALETGLASLANLVDYNAGGILYNSERLMDIENELPLLTGEVKDLYERLEQAGDILKG